TPDEDMETKRRKWTEEYIEIHCGNYSDKEKAQTRNAVHIGWELHSNLTPKKKSNSLGVLESSINGFLDGIDLDNTSDVVERSQVVGMLKDLLLLVKQSSPLPPATESQNVENLAEVHANH